jgi:methionine sulfoxide reductase heme-binding subunit
MTEEIATWIWFSLGLYALVGLSVAGVLFIGGLKAFDRVAATSPWRFKLMIFWDALPAGNPPRTGNEPRPAPCACLGVAAHRRAADRRHRGGPHRARAHRGSLSRDQRETGAVSHPYKAIQWTRFKKAYDALLGVGVIVFLAVFVAASLQAAPVGQTWSEIQLFIRATGACAFALLTLILTIGPLARLSPWFLPLLYNRRHLGVTCFLVALAHAGLVILWYHGFSDINPLVSLLTSNPRYDSIAGFPFESLGLVALVILFVMASTSHDFWNTNLGPGVWKAIHMSVYVAFALIVAHVMLGAVQGDKGFAYPVVVSAAAALVAGLHIFTGARESRRDRVFDIIDEAQWIHVGAPGDIPDRRAKIIATPSGDKIAVFRDGDKIHAVSNVCRHQGGPLGEGRIVDGCVTCPWHGFQYRPEDGRAPAPYTEKIATYGTRIIEGVIWVHAEPMKSETP